jgi:hypothetical protein
MTALTRDEIMALEGVALCEEIAVKVMGYERLPWPAVPHLQKPTPEGVRALYTLPRYDQDHNLAAEVRAKCCERWTGVEWTITESATHVQVALYRGPGLAVVDFSTAETLPIATCRVALLAASALGAERGE